MCSLWYLCLWNLLRLMVSKRKRYTSCIFVKKIFLYSLSLSLYLNVPASYEKIKHLAAKFVLFQNYIDMMEWHKHYDEKIIVLEK